MTFVISKVLWLVLAPGHLLVLLGLAGVLGLFLPWPRLRRAARWVLALVVFALAVLALVPGEVWLRPLENRFPQPSTLPGVVHGIVALGGGLSVHRSHERERPELNEAGDRLVALLELIRRYPEAKVIYSGGTAALLERDRREADAAGDFLHRMGIQSGRVILERQARNTRENVIRSKALAKPETGETWLLVTSAAHMPRAVGVFRRYAWPVIPYPVDYQTGGQLRWLSPPDLLGGLAAATIAAKEWVGLVAYRLLGWSAELLPGPEPARQAGHSAPSNRRLRRIA